MKNLLLNKPKLGCVLCRWTVWIAVACTAVASVINLGVFFSIKKRKKQMSLAKAMLVVKVLAYSTYTIVVCMYLQAYTCCKRKKEASKKKPNTSCRKWCRRQVKDSGEEIYYCSVF